MAVSLSTLAGLKLSIDREYFHQQIVDSFLSDKRCASVDLGSMQRKSVLMQNTDSGILLSNDPEAINSIDAGNEVVFSFNSGYDFQAKEITQTSCTISRDLHCFNLSASLSPFGRWKYYNVTIRANASILQDLKYEQRSQTQSNIQWY